MTSVDTRVTMYQDNRQTDRQDSQTDKQMEGDGRGFHLHLGHSHGDWNMDRMGKGGKGRRQGYVSPELINTLEHGFFLASHHILVLDQGMYGIVLKVIIDYQ